MNITDFELISYLVLAVLFGSMALMFYDAHKESKRRKLQDKADKEDRERQEFNDWLETATVVAKNKGRL